MKTQLADEPKVISSNTLRKIIGWIGILFPALLLAGNYFIYHCGEFQNSISHYYYTYTGQWLVAMLCAVGMFLLAYKGYDTKDRLVSSIAGGMAFLIALLPTNLFDAVPAPAVIDSCYLFTLPTNPLRNTIHYISAGLFFLSLAYMSLFLFTIGSAHKTKAKCNRNLLFKVCGIIIVGAVVLIALYGFLLERNNPLEKYHPVLWLEWLAMAAFGISWLVKGGAVMAD